MVGFWIFVIAVLVGHSCAAPPVVHNAPSYVSVPESVSMGTILASFRVTDSDPGDAVSVSANGDTARYVMTQVSGGVPNNHTVLLRLYTYLDREERASHQLSFTVTDSTLNQVTVNITMYVTDVNDNCPFFSQSQYDFSASESTGAGTQVGVVQAVDRDAGVNGQLTYSMQDTDGSSSMFSIDTQSGMLTLAQQPDFNVMPLYRFKVIANDRGVPSCQRSVLVTVNIIP